MREERENALLQAAEKGEEIFYQELADAQKTAEDK
jgi:hypothetical protein